jgi:hypothetical protein
MLSAICDFYRAFVGFFVPFDTFCTVMAIPAHSSTCDTSPAFPYFTIKCFGVVHSIIKSIVGCS